MGFGAGDIVGLIWSHPIASVVVALLFTPPLFPVVVFFSPLLISTALVVLAMISMGSDGSEDGGATPGGYGHSHYKRDWHEQEDTEQVLFDFDDDDGPLLNDEDRRVHKRRKGLASQQQQHDDGWLDKVKSWEETGRAWVDSVLHQEARRPGSDPLFSSSSAATEVTREVRFAQPIPQTSPAPSPAPAPPSAPADSVENAPPLAKEAADEARGPAPSERNHRASEISVEPEAELTETTAQNLRAFPLPDEEKTSKSQSLEDRGEDSRSKGQWDEEEQQQLKDAVQSKNFSAPKEEAGAVTENKRDSPNDRTDQNGAAAGRESSSTGKSSSAAAAAERERHGDHNRTPSVAVTLSEKLNVPLEDMMSLLAGDEKPSSSGGAHVERTVAHDDGGWSSSDDELARAAAAAAAKDGEQNQTPSEKSSK